MIPNFRKITVDEPAATLTVSRKADHGLLFLPGEPVKLYSFQDGEFFHDRNMPRFEGNSGVLNHKQIVGCTEAAIIGEGCIYRYSITGYIELPAIENVSATAISYNAGATAMFVADDQGKVLIYVLEGDRPRLIHTYNCEYQISHIYSHSFNDTFTGIGQGKILSVDPLNRRVEVLQTEDGRADAFVQVTSLALSPTMPLMAIAHRPDLIYASNFESSSQTLFHTGIAASDMVFLPSGMELALVLDKEVVVVDLSRFVGNQFDSLQYESVELPAGETKRVWAVRSVDDELRIVYE